ncbi:uncharacterized protein LOC105425962 [Pogonomyrmex barbatus]|uniref:Uncharacterized protein LOC105425962 n=1 Tax=Pogonomyrmex barbatus TaxID=144034 RepID=A0A6I9W982_9HYME|nr:uncharacterized protein LOC105425962 [Pogonomyrmex barbatus]
MPCDGRNPNCNRRRELLTQLKCLISSMDRKKPCEWDEPPCSPIVYCPTELPSCAPFEFVKPCKSFNFHGSIIYKCECIKRNGLQDRCMMWDCMGRSECMTKLYPICQPGRAALLKLTDLGDEEVALRKFYCANQARKNALTTYCRLVCDKARQRQIFSCDKSKCNENIKTCCTFVKNNILDTICNLNSDSKLAFHNLSSYQCNVPSPLYISCNPPCKLEESSFPCSTSPTYLRNDPAYSNCMSYCKAC